MLACVAAATLALSTVAAASPNGTWRSPHVRFEPQPGATLVVDGVGELRGTVEVRRTGGGLAVINELAIEDYLLGLAEVPSSWPAAALEAQAIAARTFAVRAALVPSTAAYRRAGADICATQSCQVYRGVERERQDANGAWAAAVRRTANRYLLWNGGLILAKYASSNGGRSDPGGAPYLPAVDDPDDAAVSPHVRWRSVIPLASIARVVGGDLVELNRSGDVVVLRRRAADGSITDQGISGAQLRRLLNDHVPTPPGVPVPVPSIRFVARTEGPDVVLDGSGYGHLVGMSQYGALGKARRGLSADDILAAYYRLRSTAIDPAQLPRTIRVAVALDARSVEVRSPSGRFRVRAADGNPVAQLTGGTWTANPAGDAIQFTGPAEPPDVHAERVDPDTIRVRLAVPSRLVVNDGQPRDLGVVDAGVHEVPVAPAAAVVVDADAGGGRTERFVVPPPLVVAAAATARPSPATAVPMPELPAKPALAMVAALLVLATGAAAVRRFSAPGGP